MKLKIKLLVGIFLCLGINAFAQLEDYAYKRKLDSITNNWHSITLPDAIFGKASSNLNDLRIYGITKTDTIEAPYILKINSEHSVNNDIPFKIINRVKTENGYYYTFQLGAEASINNIQLAFNTVNFDWLINLEGSQNQKKWFTILEDYRILSIKNNSTDFKFTHLSFEESKYRFFRVFIKNKTQPKLDVASIYKRTITAGKLVHHSVVKTEISKNKSDKTTQIDFELQLPVSISEIAIDINSDVDYYRRLNIEYLSDSLNTEKGWKYYYKTLTQGTLNSLEPNTFKFNSVVAKKIRLIIYNNDNQPLDVKTISARGYKYELVTRFTKPATYYLAYGNHNAHKPIYDINRFTQNIPIALNTLSLGEEEHINNIELTISKSLFESKYWLWGIMIVVILILGGFTLNMLKKT